MVNRVLMVAYHYPPVQVSSGLQRTLAFSRYLGDYGWSPLILSAHTRAYADTNDDQLRDIPQGVPVIRAFALNSRKHLSLGGRYLDLLALPDPWSSWWFGGVWSGLRLIRKYRPKVIWSTYPIATSHLIGLTLHKLTGLPWIADFRDSMTEPTYPREEARRRVFLWIEKKTIQACSKAVFTTPGAVSMYQKRYPGEPDGKWLQLPNGYNEDIFAEIETAAISPCLTASPQKDTRAVKLIHSGVIYPDERDPEVFFQALSNLKKRRLIDKQRLNIILRATGHDESFQKSLNRLVIDDIVQMKPRIPYRHALKEMLSADGLIILQAANCNHQVPAKLYEYFRARRPILALTDASGDTAHTLREAGLSDIAPLDDVGSIEQALLQFITSIENGSATVASDIVIEKYSRRTSSQKLAVCLDSLTG
ncbi:glycosyltransferase [Sedimenticola hydrogenitrophicus]|uniref:glycosyltransferase n=1 Tax=Sedimenticola hydrogenitrophicus TaxID=2967975 RepID=UPI0023B128A5|nr:glycosyltransferase [Sedimenticola hydrogenitrophicus]